jgi:hypothetical protein
VSGRLTVGQWPSLSAEQPECSVAPTPSPIYSESEALAGRRGSLSGPGPGPPGAAPPPGGTEWRPDSGPGPSRPGPGTL